MNQLTLGARSFWWEITNTCEGCRPVEGYWTHDNPALVSFLGSSCGVAIAEIQAVDII
jgi:hypothetical protein